MSNISTIFNIHSLNHILQKHLKKFLEHNSRKKYLSYLIFRCILFTPVSSTTVLNDQTIPYV